MSRVLPLVFCLGGLAYATPDAGAIRFRDVAAEVGIEFSHENGAAGGYHLPEIMGAGGALFDYDGDGDLDVLLVEGRALDTGQVTGRAKGPRLYRNDLMHDGKAGPALRFTDVTPQAGFAAGDLGMGVAIGDVDNDGRPDVYLTNVGPNRLYRNTGLGAFEEVTSTAGEGLDDPRWGTSAAFGDYDGDGHLDLYLANYVYYSAGDNKVCTDPAGRRDYCGPLQFRPAPDRLFRNRGNGTFEDVTEKAGLNAALGAGLGVVSRDLDGDRRLDFYVANDAWPNQLWLNRGDRFEDGALLAGVALSADGQPEGSMGIAAGDADDDGDDDLFVTNLTGETHAFYVNGGGGAFEDRRLLSRLAAATRPYTGFGTDWFDADNDGLLDLFVANGAVAFLEALRDGAVPYRQRNQLLRNLGTGRFADITSQAGGAFQLVETSRGAAFGDVDNDGDVDVLVTNNGGPVRLLLNEIGTGRSWIQLRLEGVDDNRLGLGARVAVATPRGDVLWRRARTDGSYLSSSDPRVHAGLGSFEGRVEVTVEWPTGRREAWQGVEINRIATLKQGTGRTVQRARMSATLDGSCCSAWRSRVSLAQYPPVH